MDALGGQPHLKAACDEGFVIARQRLFSEVAVEDFGGTSMGSEAGFLPAEPAVTSVVHFDEDSKMGSIHSAPTEVTPVLVQNGASLALGAVAARTWPIIRPQ